MRNSPELKRSEQDLFLGVRNRKFNFSITDCNIAEQISLLLNTNNRLINNHDSNSIINNKVQYFIRLHEQKVVGCIGLLIEPRMDKVLHLSVDHTMRRNKIGFNLLNLAINVSVKDVLYMTIRDDNIASLSLAIKCGFNVVAYKPRNGYNLLTLCLFRRKTVE